MFPLHAVHAVAEVDDIESLLLGTGSLVHIDTRSESRTVEAGGVFQIWEGFESKPFFQSRSKQLIRLKSIVFCNLLSLVVGQVSKHALWARSNFQHRYAKAGLEERTQKLR